jgi:hypothetical protein
MPDGGGPGRDVRDHEPTQLALVADALRMVAHGHLEGDVVIRPQEAARAVHAQLAQPTQAMVQAGAWAVLQHRGAGGPQELAKAVWEAMTTAALTGRDRP